MERLQDKQKGKINKNIPNELSVKIALEKKKKETKLSASVRVIYLYL